MRPACGSASGTGGCGPSITVRIVASSSVRAAARTWSPNSSAPPPRLLGLRSLRVATGLGQERPPGLPRPSHPRRPVCRRRRRYYFCSASLHAAATSLRNRRRRPALADATLRTYRYKLDAELHALLRSIPTHTAGEQRQKAIEGCRRFLFTFLANRAIPPTNNGSERALRPCVVFRKVTNCFRSEWAANLYADIRSVIDAARRRAIGVLDAIRETLNGAPLVEMRALSTNSPKG